MLLVPSLPIVVPPSGPIMQPPVALGRHVSIEKLGHIGTTARAEQERQFGHGRDVPPMSGGEGEKVRSGFGSGRGFGIVGRAGSYWLALAPHLQPCVLDGVKSVSIDKDTVGKGYSAESAEMRCVTYQEERRMDRLDRQTWH